MKKLLFITLLFASQQLYAQKFILDASTGIALNVATEIPNLPSDYYNPAIGHYTSIKLLRQTKKSFSYGLGVNYSALNVWYDITYTDKNAKVITTVKNNVMYIGKNSLSLDLLAGKILNINKSTLTLNASIGFVYNPNDPMFTNNKNNKVKGSIDRNWGTSYGLLLAYHYPLTHKLSAGITLNPKYYSLNSDKYSTNSNGVYGKDGYWHYNILSIPTTMGIRYTL